MAIAMALSIQSTYAGMGGMRLMGRGGGGGGVSGGHSGGFRAMSFMSRSVAPVSSNRITAMPNNRIGNTTSAKGPVSANRGSIPLSGIPAANTGPIFATGTGPTFATGTGPTFATTGSNFFVTSTRPNVTGNFFFNQTGNFIYAGFNTSEASTGGFRASGPIPGAPIPGPNSPSAENSGAVATPPSGNYPGTGSGIQTGVIPAPFAPSGPTPGSGNTGVGRTPPSGITRGTGASQ